MPASTITPVAGHTNCQLMLGPWSELQAKAGAVRVAVFVQEQGIPIEEEWDEHDAGAVHAALIGPQGQAIGTGRLLIEGMPAGKAKIGRMAVLEAWRTMGFGGVILQALLNEAKRRGCQAVSLHAQTSALSFYSQAGFEAVGLEFDEVGIPHQEMVIRL